MSGKKNRPGFDTDEENDIGFRDPLRHHKEIDTPEVDDINTELITGGGHEIEDEDTDEISDDEDLDSHALDIDNPDENI